ncbi:MAG TPA: cytochrome c oxidase subunit 3 [Terriglobia bacterium]|nr:cytochrome c oxidase subunit 3 [Terriglobia bacterium]
MAAKVSTPPNARHSVEKAGRENGASGRGLPVPPRLYYTGSLLAAAAVAMIFAGLTSALVVRKGVSNDWRPLVLPRLMYLNTAALLASSVALEWARGSSRRFASGTAGNVLWNRRFGWVLAIGLAFLAGQTVALRQLAARPILAAANPGAAFFYLLTIVHGAFVLGGVLAVVYAAFKAKSAAGQARSRAMLGAAAFYWHFVVALWIYLLVLLALEM